jgi:thymidylate synthase ThyX
MTVQKTDDGTLQTTTSSGMTISLLDPKTTGPRALAVGSGRSCYMPRLIRYTEESYDNDPKRDSLLEKIRVSTAKAGHNTTRMHKHLNFTFSGISRHVTWSFLHSHPFYNSEQVSQRYVRVKKGSYRVPPGLDERQDAIFQEVANRAMVDYTALRKLLRPVVEEAYFSVFPHREGWKNNSKKSKGLKSSLDKKCMELARYVLPVAIKTHMYHTVSALTLMRLYQTKDLGNCPQEQGELVGAMVDLAEVAWPGFSSELDVVDTIHRDSNPDYVNLQDVSDHAREFDERLGSRRSLLTEYSDTAEQTLARAVRSVLCVPSSKMSDDVAIACLLDPGRNTSIADTNNVNSMTDMGLAMSAVSYSFEKRLSHTADSQNQRHRMTPGTRPRFIVPGDVDIVTPMLIEGNSEVNEYFQAACARVWHGINRLRGAGASEEQVQYLAPNAIALRMVEQGNLRDLHHKFRLRLCYLAQEEIWKASVDEVAQIAEVHPSIGKYLLPPCTLRKMASKKPYCPEGDRFCGVPVWNEEDVSSYTRKI